jgi:hypothetical protein
MAPPLNHDALFKATFSRPELARARPELARAELEAILPKDLLDQLDLTTLVHVPGSFVDEELRASLTDLLFTAKLATGDDSSTTAPRVGKGHRVCVPSLDSPSKKWHPSAAFCPSLTSSSTTSARFPCRT